eukprot:12896704-Prorocentrum_lima.AAC.1
MENFKLNLEASCARPRSSMAFVGEIGLCTQILASSCGRAQMKNPAYVFVEGIMADEGFGCCGHKVLLAAA